MKTTLQPKQVLRGLLGASFAPLVALILYWAFVSLRDGAPLDELSLLGAVAGLSLAASVAGVLLLGWPIIHWLNRHAKLGWLTVLAASVVAGVVYAAAVSWLFTAGATFPQLRGAGVGALLGLCAGIGFCLAAGPNNSSKPTPLRGAA